MIRDRYAPMQLFDLVPQLALQFEPELAELDRLLDDDRLFQQIKADLAGRAPHSATTGRPGTPVEVILRMLVVKHLYGWSYAETERFVGDSLVLRQFCRLYLAPAPDDTTLLRWANQVQPATVHALLERVVALAQELHVTRGRKLRIDTTVVATHVHAPTDSALLADGVRVLGRLVHRARGLVATGAAPIQRLCRDRSRSAKRLARRIAALPASAGSEPTRPALYRRLLAVARASRRQADQVRRLVADQPGAAAARLRAALDRFAPLVDQVVAQTERRVLRGETVPASAKVVSLFEPQTAVIARGKTRPRVEFGVKVVLDEVEGGLVTRYAVLTGNPPDAASLPASLAQHQRQFARAPDLLAADRSFATAANERVAQAAGVRRVCLPRPGHQPADRQTWERQRWFRQGRRFRAGIEGRISRLKRRFGWERCRYHGAAGLERWIGWGVVAHNLAVISHTLAQRRTG
jgi:IS5 family transposase